MRPPKSREERLKWDKSLRDYALLETITEVIFQIFVMGFEIEIANALKIAVV